MSQYNRLMRSFLAYTLMGLGGLWLILSVADIFTHGVLLDTSRLLHTVREVMLGLLGITVGLLVLDRA